MLKRILLALVVGVVAALICYGLGLILEHVAAVGFIGSFLVAVAWLVGLLAGVWYYLTGQVPA